MTLGIVTPPHSLALVGRVVTAHVAVCFRPSC